MRLWSVLLQEEKRRCEMWQKDKGKFHLLLNYSSDTMDGLFRHIACKDDSIQFRRAKQDMFAPHENCCKVCWGVYRLICTSVDDAKKSLAFEMDLVVLYRAEYLTKSKTLRKAIFSRIVKLKKDAEKERKLQLIQKAYD